MGGQRCGVTTGNELWCWTRQPPALGFPVTTVVDGYGLSCAVAVGCSAYCWGLNYAGQLGDGTTTDRTSPVPVAGNRSFSELVVGRNFVCGLEANGTTWC